MSGIYGIFRFDGAPIVPEYLQRMRGAMAYYGPDGGGEWRDGPVGLGQLQLRVTPEDRFEAQPLTIDGMTLVSAARLDNREELLRAFKIPTADHSTTPDSTLVLEAYRSWGQNCPDHLNGDWQFAVWDSRCRALFIARDHHGNTGLSYYHNPRFFAFASHPKGLLTLPDVPRRPDLLMIAMGLVGQDDYGVRTAYEDLLRLPPAHTLLVTDSGLNKRRYWHPEQLPELRLPNDRDYVEQFLDVYSQAVSSRLRSERPVGLSLSGGLDSGSVAALAAPLLAAEGKKLTAFTSVPLSKTIAVGNHRIGDEWPLASATAKLAGNIDHLPVRSEGVSVLDSIARQIEIMQEPIIAAANCYWLLDMMDQASSLGIGTLLTGQCGNGTVSFSGGSALLPSLLLRGEFRQALRAFRLSEANAWYALKRQILKPLLLPAMGLFRYYLNSGGTPWNENAVINPRFAREMQLAEHMRSSRCESTLTPPCDRRLQLIILRLGKETEGAIWHELGTRYGLDVRDPTNDRRVVEFCLRIPDLQYRRHGVDRWLIRQAMAGRMPREVLNCRNKGLQAADVGHRVLSERTRFAAELDRLERSELAQKCLDLDRMRTILKRLESDGDEFSLVLSMNIFLNGVNIGLFLSGF